MFTLSLVFVAEDVITKRIKEVTIVNDQPDSKNKVHKSKKQKKRKKTESVDESEYEEEAPQPSLGYD